MRILVILPEQLPVPPILGGSVESCTHNIFRRMAETEQVTLISRAHHRLPTRSVYKNGKYHILRIPQKNRLAYIRAVLRQVRKQSFDIIQIENRPTFVPFVRKAFPRTPIVLSLHSLTFMTFLTKARANAILRQVNAVTSVVSFVSQTMKKRYPAHARKFHTCILGVDTKKFRPHSLAYKMKLRKRWKLTSGFNVLFVGRIIQGKGLHTLIQAVFRVKKTYPRVRLIAVGASWPSVQRQTRYIKKVRSMSRRLRVPIRFTGYIPPARVHRMYHLGDVFVCPTQFREGFATVNSEAMASGIPVIASNRGGISEVIKHGISGWLVQDYKNPAAFADAIMKLKASPKLVQKLVEGGRRHVEERFSWYNTSDKLKKLYIELLNRS
ncbi:glycosyltransferase family 4 protein [Aneurinibacillus migulanus]|uniref:Glycosyltransferase involved in cell wall bisynthesis n=1 Tax=Aneurinibacillus migulanus TaxID=47500 RepID=A0A0D1XSP4_ANEMI|nr:glycosyltransferase family 4 protein [Aneurinibacillus migulanus]KIV57271.1 spore coat protein [Aneurinibacillus migulanus]KON96834.1 spore coat protein [Aneurinibacillus migulanus]MED0895194.1 glycosyltransferase family 4 protein [Aneurinibacillus migulanus]MED1619486.1 glycosyltransferase family 4 protein [Aneurinibacillus migulanus]SDJ58541.1 Glycosyltransferase involved in cell wall bisynthesis [Aneurinibacillus migulanus]